MKDIGGEYHPMKDTVETVPPSSDTGGEYYPVRDTRERVQRYERYWVESTNL